MTFHCHRYIETIAFRFQLGWMPEMVAHRNMKLNCADAVGVFRFFSEKFQLIMDTKIGDQPAQCQNGVSKLTDYKS